MQYVAYQHVQSRFSRKVVKAEYGRGPTPEDAIFDATHTVRNGQTWAKQYAPNKTDLRTMPAAEFDREAYGEDED